MEALVAIDTLLATGGSLERAAAILLAALVLDWLVADMRWFWSWVPHPVAWVGGLTAFLDRKLNRESRSRVARLVRGTIVAATVIATAAAAGYGLERGLRSIPFGWTLELFVVTTLIAQRSLFSHVRAVGRALKRSSASDARAALSHIVGRDTSALQPAAMVRAAIESLAENFSDGVVAPAFWYLLLGLPGLIAYKTINTMDSMIGYKSERHADFGMTAARVDDAVNWLPARLAGPILVTAAIIAPTANPAMAGRTIASDAGKHASPNAGWPEAAMAGALDLSLGGPRTYPGGQSEDAWIGTGRRDATPQDVDRALVLFVLACVILWLLVAVLGLYVPTV